MYVRRANGSRAAAAATVTFALLVALPGARASEPAGESGVTAASAAPAHEGPATATVPAKDAPAPAARPAGDPGDRAANAATKKASDPMICRTESDIGSRIPTRKCRRKSEIDAEARDSQQRLQDGVRSTARPGPNPAG